MTVTSKQKLVDLAIKQIKDDLATGDLMGLDELLWLVSEDNLENYLSEDRLQEYKDEQNC